MQPLFLWNVIIINRLENLQGRSNEMTEEIKTENTNTLCKFTLSNCSRYIFEWFLLRVLKMSMHIAAALSIFRFYIFFCQNDRIKFAIYA